MTHVSVTTAKRLLRTVVSEAGVQHTAGLCYYAKPNVDEPISQCIVGKVIEKVKPDAIVGFQMNHGINGEFFGADRVQEWLRENYDLTFSPAARDLLMEAQTEQDNGGNGDVPWGDVLEQVGVNL